MHQILSTLRSPKVFSRRLPALLLAGLFLLPNLSPRASAQESGPPGPRTELSEILEQRRAPLSDPFERRRVAEEIRREQEERKRFAETMAAERGLPVRYTTPAGQVAELMDFIADEPVYAITYNENAAISVNTHLVRPPSDLDIDAAGFTIGLWDAGSVRNTHEAFAGRVTLRDGAAFENHATHVGGTLAAAGPETQAHGMSPAIHLDSYDWNNDKSQMTDRGASYPNEPGTLQVSNHSYGFRAGWVDRGTYWEWMGSGTDADAFEPDFGRYNASARDIDALAHNLPYYLPFWAAGNDRNNNPPEGAEVRIGRDSTSYNSSFHPPGDGVYKGGYDTLGFESVAKNVVTVGAVNDAVRFGERDLDRATMTAFSTWGPTDDGRIKPDIVANGASLYSTSSSGDTAYSRLSGTSMATPNAAGSAALLLAYHDELFADHRMRASTLRALLIHTADDLGNPGPDYRFGWGLLNTRAAADHLLSHSASPGSKRMIEDVLTSSEDSLSYSFSWDGNSPVRATLAWTDPAASATGAHDDRSPRLVNDLDLLLICPEGETHYPYVMPYVGSWSQETIDQPATTGRNNVDNVEQVFIDSPEEPGEYTAIVTIDGDLTGNQQFFSLLISGSDAMEAVAPEIASSSPDEPTGSVTTLEITGSGFQLGADVLLVRDGEEPVATFGQEVLPDRIKARLATDGIEGGTWDVKVRNPDGQSAIVEHGFHVIGPLWKEDFEGEVSGWTAEAEMGDSHWSLTNEESRSPEHSQHAIAPANINIDHLISPVIEIPEEAENLSLSFWHRYQFGSRHGGLLELSLDGGIWEDVTDAEGASFSSGGYNTTIPQSGGPQRRNPLHGRSAWGGSQSSFGETLVELDPDLYAGRELRLRWTVATGEDNERDGWFIDDIALLGTAPPTVTIPYIVSGPTPDQDPVTGASVGLSVDADDDAGEENLTYHWSVNDSFEYPVAFSENASNAAKTTTASFSRAGEYLFEVSVRNQDRESTTGSVPVTVEAVPTETAISPSELRAPVDDEVAFTADVLDQFGHALSPRPPFQWQLEEEAGSIDSDASVQTASTPGGPFEVTAETDDGFKASAILFLRQPDWEEWKERHFTEEQIADPAFSADTADPDGDGLANLIEFALGGDPLAPGSGKRPKIQILDTDEGRIATIQFTRPAEMDEHIEYTVEASNNFNDWTVLPKESWEIETGDATETITVRDNAGPERRFLRLRVKRQAD